MNRAINYRIFCDETVFENNWSAISNAKRAIEAAFTWSNESPRLSPTAIDGDYYNLDLPDLFEPDPEAWGSTDIGDDDWNAILILRFLQWISEQIPSARICVDDDGSYLRLGCATLEGGIWKADKVAVKRRMTYLLESGRWRQAKLLGESEAAEARGEWFTPVSAYKYRDRREIRVLGLSDVTLSRVTLDQLTKRMSFPWKP